MCFLALLLRRSKLQFQGEFGEEGRENFFLAAGKYFQASWAELEELRAQGLPAEEIPAALFVSRHAGVPSEGVGLLRRSGRNWRQILGHYKLSPDLFHVPLTAGVPLAPVRTSRERHNGVHEVWKSLPASDDESGGASAKQVCGLTDADFINLANLKFISESYAINPDKVVALRAAGWTFAAILAELVPRQSARETSGKSNRVRRAG